MSGPAFIAGMARAPLSAGRGYALRTSAMRPSRVAVATVKHRRSEVRMISAEAARGAIAVYGVVIAGGGIGAFLRTGSKPSVISGVIAGIVLAAAYVKDSIPIALYTALALAVVFGIRLSKTKKFMPSGMLCVASVIAAVFFATSIYG